MTQTLDKLEDEVRIRLTRAEKQNYANLSHENQLKLSTFLRTVLRRECPNYSRNRFWVTQ